MYYFVARTYLLRERLIYTVGDRFLFKLPGYLFRIQFELSIYFDRFFFVGWGIISEAFNVSPGTIQSCSNILKDGNMLAISPGGVYEAQFGNNNYELLWRRRLGFAKVAIDSKAVGDIFSGDIINKFCPVLISAYHTHVH